MKKVSILAAIIVLATGLSARTPLFAQTAQQQAPAKPETKAPAGIAGKWTLTVETPQGSMANTLEIKLDGKKVTGSMTSQMGTSAIEGEYVDNKLTFSMSLETPNGNFDIAWSGALKADGTLAGSASVGDMGQMSWTAERIK